MKAKVVYSYQLESISRGSLKQKQQRHNCFPLPFLCNAKVNLMTLEICDTETSLEFLRLLAEQRRDTVGSNLPRVLDAVDKNIHSGVGANYETHNEHNSSFGHPCWFAAKREVFMLLLAHCISRKKVL